VGVQEMMVIREGNEGRLVYGRMSDHAFPIVSAIIGLGAFASYVVCIVLAAQTGRLKALDWVMGTLGLFCGIGWIYFLARANTVTLQHSFALIEQGGDPAVSRALNKRFKIAAGLAIVFGIVAYIAR
jgi:hypothetical protein